MPTDTGQDIAIEVVDASQKTLSQPQIDFIGRWGKHFFGSLPMTTKYTWTGANETRFNVFIYKNSEIVSRLRIVSRKAEIDGESLELGGVGGVMTIPAHQGQGFATLALREADRLIFQVLNAQLGALVCLPELVRFYEKFRWRIIACPVTFEQPDGVVVWSECSMLLPKPGENWTPRAVNFRGLPF
jgi:predicted acetyltransferase